MSRQHAARRCVRDELFLLAHDQDYGYRPRIQTASLAVGLAGATLIDLVLAGAVQMANGHIAIRSRYGCHDPNDPIAARVVADVAMTGTWIPLREVIAGTALDLYERMLIHLITTDVITAKPDGSAASGTGPPMTTTSSTPATTR